jgi:hypothetical protein
VFGGVCAIAAVEEWKEVKNGGKCHNIPGDTVGNISEHSRFKGLEVKGEDVTGVG